MQAFSWVCLKILSFECQEKFKSKQAFDAKEGNQQGLTNQGCMYELTGAFSLVCGLVGCEEQHGCT